MNDLFIVCLGKLSLMKRTSHNTNTKTNTPEPQEHLICFTAARTVVCRFQPMSLTRASLFPSSAYDPGPRIGGQFF